MTQQSTDNPNRAAGNRAAAGDQLAAAHRIIAEQSALIAKCHAALEACVQEFGDENPDDDWDAIVKARAAIALCEGRS